MSEPPHLNADGEAAWLRFKQHLEWCDGFALIFVFSNRPEVSAIFRERLSAIHRARITGLMLEHRKPLVTCSIASSHGWSGAGSSARH